MRPASEAAAAITPTHLNRTILIAWAALGVDHSSENQNTRLLFEINILAPILKAKVYHTPV